GKPHRDLAEKRRDRMVPVIFHSAHLATASAVRPPDGVALGLRRDDLLLEAGQQQLPFGQGHPYVGDITEIIRPVDLQDVGALSLTVSPGFHQPHNPSHAPTPDQRSDAKLPLRPPHPQSPGSPLYRAVTNRDPDALVIVPPRATAVPSKTRETKPTQRDQHLQDIAAKGRIAWQKASGYNKRSRVETMIGRYKQVIGDGLRFHKDERRGTEVRVAVHVLNRMSKLGRPISVRIA